MVTELLFAPFVDYGFMRLGLVAALSVGATCGLLSGVLVVRGQSLLGDAIGHAVLLGVVVGHVVAGPLGVPVGAMLAALLMVTVTSVVSRHAPLHRETSMGLVFAPMFALGLVLISMLRPRGIDLFHVLFGNVLGVSGTGAAMGLVVGVVVVGAVVLLLPALTLWCFDPVGAEAAGLNVRRLEQAFFVMLAATVVVALQTVGLILVVAMLILPGATGRLLATSFPMMLLLSATTGVVSGTAGLLASFHLDVASGPAIVLVCGLLCYVALLVAAVPPAFAATRAAASTSSIS